MRGPFDRLRAIGKFFCLIISVPSAFSAVYVCLSPEEITTEDAEELRLKAQRIRTVHCRPSVTSVASVVYISSSSLLRNLIFLIPLGG
jgi:hypothetical protein